MVSFMNVADLRDPNDNLGRTYREVANATKHTFDVGTLIELPNGVRLFVAYQYRDCDGTPLYALAADEDETEQMIGSRGNANWFRGCPEEDMKAT